MVIFVLKISLFSMNFEYKIDHNSKNKNHRNQIGKLIFHSFQHIAYLLIFLVGKSTNFDHKSNKISFLDRFQTHCASFIKIWPLLMEGLPDKSRFRENPNLSFTYLDLIVPKPVLTTMDVV